MDYLSIGESKVKIILSREEVVKYALPTDGKDTKEARRALRRILEDSDVGAKFLSVGERLLIQTYSRDQGAEIFVTKLGRLSDGTERTLLRSGQVTLLKTKRYIYRFFSIDAMLDALALDDISSVCENASIFDDGSGEYVLVLSMPIFGDVSMPGSFLNEFAEELDEIFFPYILEHGSLLYESGYLKANFIKKRDKENGQ